MECKGTLFLLFLQVFCRKNVIILHFLSFQAHYHPQILHQIFPLHIVHHSSKCHRDSSGLLRDNNSDSVGLFRYSHRRAVAKAIRLWQIMVGRNRKNTCGTE